MSCTTDLPLADRRPDVEVLLVHDDVLTLPSRVRVGSPHALVFTPRTRNQREEQNQCSSQRFITVLITFAQYTSGRENEVQPNRSRSVWHVPNQTGKLSQKGQPNLLYWESQQITN